MAHQNTKEHLAVAKPRCQAHFSPNMLFQNDQALNSFFPQADKDEGGLQRLRNAIGKV